MISIDHLILNYKIQNEHVKNLKEFLIRLSTGKLTYHTFCAIDDVSLKIPKGQVCGIIGRNGAGKSTLLKAIAGILQPSQGTIQVQGNIAPMLELGAGFDMDLTASENIYLNGAVLGYSKEFLNQKYDEIVEFSELRDFVDQPIRTFSSGMLMRLAFSVATMVEPDVLIVDEILSVGDSHFKRKSEMRMRKLMAGGTTVLMVSHAVTQIAELCDRVIWLEKGKVRMDGFPKEVCSCYEQETLAEEQ